MVVGFTFALGFVTYYTNLTYASANKWIYGVWNELSSGPASGDQSPILVLCCLFSSSHTIIILEVKQLVELLLKSRWLLLRLWADII